MIISDATSRSQLLGLLSTVTSNYRAAMTIASVSLLAACATVALAPGADKVRVTSNSQDVASCTAVGNVRVPPNAQSTVTNPIDDLRNQTLGLGGNTTFVTSAELGEGIAYHCP